MKGNELAGGPTSLCCCVSNEGWGLVTTTAKHLQTFGDWIVSVCRVLLGHVGIFRDCQDLWAVGIFQNWSRCVGMCQHLSWFVKDLSGFVGLCRICPDLSAFVGSDRIFRACLWRCSVTTTAKKTVKISRTAETQHSHKPELDLRGESIVQATSRGLCGGEGGWQRALWAYDCHCNMWRAT